MAKKMMTIEEILAFIAEMFSETECRRSEDGGVSFRFRRASTYGHEEAARLFAAIARAAGCDAKRVDSLVRMSGEPTQEVDPCRVVLEAGFLFEITSHEYKREVIFDSVDLREVDLTALCVTSPYGSSCDRRRFAADLRGARPIEAFVCEAVGRFDVRALDLGRSVFDEEQVEHIVKMCEADPQAGLLAIVRNAACTAEQSARVVAALDRVGGDAWRDRVDMLCAHSLDEDLCRLLVARLPRGEISLVLAECAVNPRARELLTARRMALAPEEWRHLAPASVPVTAIKKDAAFQIPGDLIASYDLSGNEFPRDALANVREWWKNAEDANGDWPHVLQVSLTEEGSVHAVVYEKHWYDDEDGDSWLMPLAILDDPAAVFADRIDDLVRTWFERQVRALAALEGEYARHRDAMTSRCDRVKQGILHLSQK